MLIQFPAEASSGQALPRSTEQPVATKEATQPTHVLAEHVETLHLLVYEMVTQNNTIEKPTLADYEKKRPADLVKQLARFW